MEKSTENKIITPEKRHNYYIKYMEKNKDKVNKKEICSICCGSYTYFNKSTHNKSRRHKMCLMNLNKT